MMEYFLLQNFVSSATLTAKLYLCFLTVSSLQVGRGSRASSSPSSPQTISSSSSSNNHSESSSTVSTPSPVTRVRSNCKRSNSSIEVSSRTNQNCQNLPGTDEVLDRLEFRSDDGDKWKSINKVTAIYLILVEIFSENGRFHVKTLKKHPTTDQPPTEASFTTGNTAPRGFSMMGLASWGCIS